MEEGYLAGNCMNSDYRVVMKSIPEVIVASMQVHMDSYEDLLNVCQQWEVKWKKAGCEMCNP